MKKHVALFSSLLMMSTTFLGSGTAFAALSDSSNKTASTPVTSELTSDNGVNPTPPGGNGEDNNNQGNNVNTHMGFVYTPKTFSFPSTKLNESGQQTIDVQKADSNGTFNLGIKDKSRGNRGWTVKAQLQWTGNQGISGAKILTHNNGTVKINQNDGTSNFSPDDLVPETEEKVIAVSNAEITGSKTLLMTAKTLENGLVHNAVYDYDLGNVQLLIPDTTNITAGSKAGTVNWSLELAPNSSH